jgi:hypothetical protein
VTKYWERLRTEGRACSCNATDVPHLEQFVSVRAILERLGLPTAPETLKAHWEEVGADAAEEARFDAVLRETGVCWGTHWTLASASTIRRRWSSPERSPTTM